MFKKSHVPKEDGLRLVVYSRLLEVLERSCGVVPPELLELVDLMKRDLASSELFLLGGNLDEPGQERAVLDERRPLGRVPDDVLGALHRRAGLPVCITVSSALLPHLQSSSPAKQHDDRVAFGWDEAEDEDVLRSAGVALGRRLSERTLGVQGGLLVFRSNKVVDDVGSGGGAAPVKMLFWR